MMVLLAISPCLFKAWKNPQPRKIARWIAYAYSCGFIFGWHVHEKATLHFLIPMAVTAIDSISDARHYFLLSIGTTLTSGCISLLLRMNSNLLFTGICLVNLSCFGILAMKHTHPVTLIFQQSKLHYERC